MRPIVVGFGLAMLLTSYVMAQEMATDRDRREAEAAYQRGEERMRSESFEEAAAEFRRAIKLDPDLWLAQYGLGQSQMAMRSYASAIEAYQGCRTTFERTALLDSGTQARYAALRLAERNELRDSLQRLRSGQLKLSTTQVTVLQAHMEERLRILETPKGQERRTGHAPAELMLALGSAYFRNGQRPEAQKAYEDAVRADQKLGAAHNNLAVIHMLDGRYVEAKESLKRAEKYGFQVSPAFKDELAKRARAAAKEK